MEDQPNPIPQLLNSPDPSIRYKTLVDVLGHEPESAGARQAREEIRTSERVQRMLSFCAPSGRMPGAAYAKWSGDHWLLAQLADIGYPSGDPALIPLRDHVYEVWLSARHTSEKVCYTKASTYGPGVGVPIIDGRARRCGSQEGNALYSTLTLGIADERADQLASNLIRWQWPDGGWNCDKNTTADMSSFHETILPIRGLALHAKVSGNAESRVAAERAAEVFLKRRMFRRLSNGKVIHREFIRLHYPAYWHYDILMGLKVMAEAGFIGDPRCSEALDLLESKRLPDGGFPCEGKYYRLLDEPKQGCSLVDWGGTSTVRMNEYVTVEALKILRLAGRF